MDHPAPRHPAESCPAYDLYGPEIPASPLVISIPHAGRAYTSDILARSRTKPDMLRRLEDRWADLLAHALIARGYSVLVARTPRAVIDLNRHEREVDPGMVAGLPRDQPLQSSIKLRGGLGLIPRRLHGVGELWLRPTEWMEIQRRLDAYHRPYHAAVARLTAAAHSVHGHAVLLDLHSMPPLPIPANGEDVPRIVLGDRFGRSASARLIALAADIATGRGIVTAQNHPYAGDHLIERHGRPESGFHALQIEIDRALYLDAALDQPGPGLAAMRTLVTDIAQALAREMPRADYAMAAE